MSLNENIEQIKYNISEIDITFRQYKKYLVLSEANEIGELSSIAIALNSFYNGLEKIFISIYNYKGKPLPSGSNWHKELINGLFETKEFEKLIFPLPIKDVFEEYLLFRHFIRNVYGYRLRWDKMEHLVVNLKPNWKAIKTHLKKFLDEVQNKKSEV